MNLLLYTCFSAYLDFFLSFLREFSPFVVDAGVLENESSRKNQERYSNELSDSVV